MTKKFKGKNILEVWDFRLSKGSPILYSNGPTWVVKIWANNPGKKNKVLRDQFDTGISTKNGVHDCSAIARCYEWLASVRDQHSKDNIEDRKVVTRLINAANSHAVSLNTEAATAANDGNIDLFNQLNGELQAHLITSNAAIKQATKVFQNKVSVEA